MKAESIQTLDNLYFKLALGTRKMVQNFEEIVKKKILNKELSFSCKQLVFLCVQRTSILLCKCLAIFSQILKSKIEKVYQHGALL